MPRTALTILIALVLVVACGCVVVPYQPAPGSTDEVEPNDQRGLADPVAGMSIRGSIAHQGDVDWFVLRGQEGVNPTFTITHAAGSDFDFEIYSNNNPVGRALGVNSGDSIRCRVPGRCHVRVWSAGGAGPYSIHITTAGGPVQPPAGSDEREPNDQRRLADPVAGMLIRGSIRHRGDVDWFVLRGQEGVNPTFTITHGEGNDLDFEIYSDNNRVGSAVGVHSGDSIGCRVPGRCYVRVWSARGAGPYRIHIRSAAGPLPGGSDEREPNDRRGLADPVAGMSIRGSMRNQIDVDWFVLRGQEGTNPTFTITHAPGNDFDFEIYSNNSRVGRAIGVNSGDRIRCPVPGRCYVRVWSARGAGAYKIRIRR